MSRHKVFVYTSRGCHYCERVLQLLRDNNVEFEERNISDHRPYFDEMKEFGIYGTPVTFVGEEKVLGFQEKQLKKKLGINRTNMHS
ncbi:glutaredoxin family protein [Pontibacillus litoralis]|uniref:Glutaredoxin n=1 Tax=Pontibacillus litoralis JSM 072002 TaxID=1385512 RepID=A0A0A5G664_9BACI|nr:glutaredoxin family protein [Pontibacillus litoralis]KGX86575.1 glutaredoxin [Pontibacillus litoralis JSM 072002]